MKTILKAIDDLKPDEVLRLDVNIEQYDHLKTELKSRGLNHGVALFHIDKAKRKAGLVRLVVSRKPIKQEPPQFTECSSMSDAEHAVQRVIDSGLGYAELAMHPQTCAPGYVSWSVAQFIRRRADIFWTPGEVMKALSFTMDELEAKNALLAAQSQSAASSKTSRAEGLKQRHTSRFKELCVQYPSSSKTRIVDIYMVCKRKGWSRKTIVDNLAGWKNDNGTASFAPPKA